MKVVIGHVDVPTPHRHRFPNGVPYWIAGITLRGPVHTRFADYEYIGTEHDVSVMRPGLAYSLVCPPPAPRHEEYYAVFSKPGWWAPEWEAWPQVVPGAYVVRVQAPQLRREIVTVWRQALKYSQSARPRAKDLALHALRHALILSGEAAPSAQPAIDTRVRTAVEHVRTHLADELDVPQLAGVAHLSPSRFAHRFAAELGTSPMRYVERLRMERAKELLIATSDAVQDIALQVGFVSPFHFSRRFRAVVGRSPLGYRRRPDI